MAIQTLISALPLCLCRARCQNNNKITLSHMSVACLFSLQQPGSFAMLIRLACTVRECVCGKCECILISLPSYLSSIPRVALLSFGNTCSQCARSVDDSIVQFKLCIIKCSKDRCASARFNSCVCVCVVRGVVYMELRMC